MDHVDFEDPRGRGRQQAYETTGLSRLYNGKESACPCRETWAVLDPELERSPGIGNSNLLQYSFLDNPMQAHPWWAAVHGVEKESVVTAQHRVHSI